MQQNPRSILQQHFGYSAFRGKQEAIIEAVLAGKDTLALLPTGGGKSVCFQVPTLMQDGLCLVISPLIALMKDQVENLKKKNISAAAIHSGLGFYEVKQTLQEAASGAYKFLYVSPERLETHLFLEYLPALDICLIAIDEAHCISQWGYDFRPPYLRIAKLKQHKPGVPMLALTASATPAVQSDICNKLQFNNPAIFKQSFEKPNLSFSVFQVDSKINKLIEILQHVPGSAVVYCSSRKRTKEMANLLALQHINASFYHAGLTQEERNQKQEAWINNTTRVMVCTNAFGMGIDKPDVRTVVHFDTPDCVENYYQEAGRAGRDDHKAYAVLLYTETDAKALTTLPDSRFPEVAVIKQVYQSLANHLQIAVGTGEGQYFDFEFNSFCKLFKLDIHLVMGVLKVLEQEGHIYFNESIFFPAQLVFTADKDSLYVFEKEQPIVEPLIKTLLRTYEGIFDNSVSISEKLLAKLLRTSADSIQQQLLQLHQSGIVQYQPQKENPQIQFVLNRAPAEFLSINLDHYFQRKQLLKERIATMLQYLTTLPQQQCRSSFLAAYFGDTTVQACGICDHCLAQKRAAFNTDAVQRITAQLLAAIPETGIDAKTLVAQLKGVKKEQLWEILAFLQTERKVVVDSFGLVRKQGPY
jgi:ATP-dependent DNA helicase RecQ